MYLLSLPPPPHPPSIPVPIPAPVGVVIQPLAPPQGHTHKVLLQANWTSPSDVSGYTLQCSAEGVGPLTLQAQVVAPGNTVSALLLANPNTLYNCSIAAVCGSGDCSLKTYVLVQTPEIGESLVAAIHEWRSVLCVGYVCT